MNFMIIFQVEAALMIDEDNAELVKLQSDLLVNLVLLLFSFKSILLILIRELLRIWLLKPW